MTTADFFNLYRQACRRVDAMPRPTNMDEWQAQREACVAADALLALYWGKVAA